MVSLFERARTNGQFIHNSKDKIFRHRHFKTKEKIMLDDDTNVLPDTHNTGETQIQAFSVKSQIDYQQAIINERQKLIIDANNTIVTATSDIELAKLTLSFLKGLPQAESVVIDVSNLSDKAMTLKIIEEEEGDKGVMIPEMKEIAHKKYNRNISSTTLDIRVNELLEEKAIFQANEGQLRSKRYKIKNL